MLFADGNRLMVAAAAISPILLRLKARGFHLPRWGHLSCFRYSVKSLFCSSA